MANNNLYSQICQVEQVYKKVEIANSRPHKKIKNVNILPGICYIMLDRQITKR